MADDKCCLNSLETFVKVEEAEFQTINQDLESAEKERKFDPLEIPVKREADVIKTEQAVVADKISISEAKGSLESIQSVTVDDLVSKGNEGKSSMESHTCCICEKVYSNRRNVKKHIETIHYQATEIFCDLCPKIYFSKKDISNHMRTVHSEKRFICDFCDYQSSLKCHFERHKLQHTAKVKCKICKKLVTSMQKHLLSHRPKETCPFCKKMITKGAMKKHMEGHRS